MVEKALLEDIRKRSAVMLGLIEKTLRAVNDEVLAQPREGWPLWKQFYHLLYWLDYWFIDPLSFRNPAFHEEHFMQPEVVSPMALTKCQLVSYYDGIKARIDKYLSAVTGEEVQRQCEVRNQKRSRLDMMLGQYLHVGHHLGYICATVRAQTGEPIWDTGHR